MDYFKELPNFSVLKYNLSISTCNHKFHNECLSKETDYEWRKSYCPICKEPINI